MIQNLKTCWTESYSDDDCLCFFLGSPQIAQPEENNRDIQPEPWAACYSVQVNMLQVST